ncbi:MAG: N-acetylmuramoyl-L-alanine amidase [Lachnospiraceae bacterium]|nr:N-acetylmuramoyl-L-alanine amidase [Lachnospiraceae bacterium]MBR4816153.1 N-acetylmuramoyl-L-alanine amidase [Lachnospiraceae bacterium]
MSSRAMYNVLYDQNDRDRRKKAFIRKRKRKRLLVLLSFFGVVLILLIIIIILLVNFIKNKYNEHIENITYKEYVGEYNDVWLVDNSLGSALKGVDTFFEIEDKPELTEADRRAALYKDIIPGSKGLVIVDAGHGGYDGGAEGNGILEKTINLEISYKLKEELELRGYSVKLTRPYDEFVGLTQRASIANALDDPVCLISIHQNSLDASEGSASGMESWTYDREGCEDLGIAVAEAAAKKTGAKNRGTHFRKNLVVTSKTTMPAIIFECGYVTDATEAAKLADPAYQSKIAEGIVDGIDNFKESYYGG